MVSTDILSAPASPFLGSDPQRYPPQPTGRLVTQRKCRGDAPLPVSTRKKNLSGHLLGNNLSMRDPVMQGLVGRETVSQTRFCTGPLPTTIVAVEQSQFR